MHARTHTHIHMHNKSKKEKVFYEEASTVNLKFSGLVTTLNVSLLTCHVHMC